MGGLDVAVLFDLGVFVGGCDSAVEFEFAAFQDAHGSVQVEVSEGVGFFDDAGYDVVEFSVDVLHWLGFEGGYEGFEGFLVFGSVLHLDVGHGFASLILWLVSLIWALSGGGGGWTPLFFVVVVWGCFVGFFVVWRVFLSPFGVVLVLFSYCMATVLLEGLVGVVSVCFSVSFRRVEGRNVSDGVFIISLLLISYK